MKYNVVWGGFGPDEEQGKLDSPTHTCFNEKTLSLHSLMANVVNTSGNDAIPSIRRAAAAFLSDARELGEEWTRLAEDITQVATTAATKVGDTALDERTLNQIKELEDILSAASSTLARSHSRGIYSIIKRLFHRSDYLSKIQEHRERVHSAKKFFEAVPMPRATPGANPTPSHHGTRPKYITIVGNKVENNITEASQAKVYQIPKVAA
ncbi:hypothetical protein AB1N83_005948 [Pleurotus pulmonarius]